ncbi:hypothetical protein [Schleiferilactobacillus shenzhenensis]|uniref:Uncharacterized protein n=1 Tax=Schleiferilactobacillus shenzhenensis LY-73 TaxID=1231336 RepID=U4TJL8_9LACO|nr:hypothetical protein [Schleiferilactobacillus shenzhenensis]ERL65026.1 hypothetical protein L248_3188 [Schleiferilactobacillus shenzhenensis LY-73]
MLDVKNSIERLQWTVDHHFLHIQAQHPFMRAWAVQFELAYTDFRVIQMALQLSGPENHALLARLAKNYEAIFAYEYEFAGNGLDGFNAKFGDQIDQYHALVTEFDGIIDEVKKLQPAETD